jgi:hypothetical protein
MIVMRDETISSRAFHREPIYQWSIQKEHRFSGVVPSMVRHQERPLENWPDQHHVIMTRNQSLNICYVNYSHFSFESGF